MLAKQVKGPRCRASELGRAIANDACQERGLSIHFILEKFDEIMEVLAQEKVKTREKLQTLQTAQGIIKQEAEKIREQKERVSLYRKAEESKLKKIQEIKKLQEDLRALMQETKQHGPLETQFEEETKKPEEKRELSEEEELERLQALREERSRRWGHYNRG